MARDPRWGRTEEFFSEDPYLAARYAEKGVSEFKKSRSLICCKHFCATGDGYGGLNTAEVNVGERELHDIHLPAAAKAINAGADLIMAAYNTVDGIPCHVNRYVLQDVLRKELGFKGIVLSDGWGVERAIAQMGYDGEKKEFSYYCHDKLPHSYHGTGDIFSSTFVGAMMNGIDWRKAVEVAADYTAKCIAVTIDSGKEKHYGVDFESCTKFLLDRLDKAKWN